MTSIQFFYNRDFPGNALRSNARQALDRLGMKPEMRETEAAPEQVGALLPALAIDGEIVVSGVEPSVRELEILFEDHAQEWEEDSACGACGMECGGVNGTEHCPMCGQHGEGGSVAGRIIGFVILLIILFLASGRLLSAPPPLPEMGVRSGGVLRGRLRRFQPMQAVLIIS